MPKKITITNAEPLHRPRRSMKAKKVFDPSDNYLPKKMNKHSISISIKSNNIKKNNQETESQNSLVNNSSDCTSEENNDTLIHSPVPSSSSTHTEMPDAKTIPCVLCCEIADVQDIYCCLCSVKVHQDCLFMGEPMWKIKLDSSPWICESCRESHCSLCFKSDKEKLLSCITCEVGVHPHCYDSCNIKPLKMIKGIDVFVCIPCLTLATQRLSEEEEEDEEEEEEEKEEVEEEREEEKQQQSGNDREMEKIEDSGERVEEDGNEIMEEESEVEIDDCERRWKNIRETYITYMLQKKKCSTRSTDPDKKTPATKLQLSFLDSAKSISNIEEIVSDTNNDSSVEQEELTTTQDLPSTSYGGKRIRSNKDKLLVVLAKRAKDRNKILPQIQTQNEVLTKNMQGIDDIDLFFKSIALTIKKLPPQTIRDAKIKILSYVSQLENQNLATQRPFENNHSKLNIS